jgi:putative FmdB family regulatory protein
MHCTMMRNDQFQDGIGMPSYDFRCEACGRGFSLFYKSVKDYVPEAERHCPHCQSTDVHRRIKRVAIGRGDMDFAKFESNDMLNVLNGGNSKEIGRMFQQVADSTGEDMGQEYNQATRRLLDGDSLDSVEREMQDSSGGTLAAGGDDL